MDKLFDKTWFGELTQKDLDYTRLTQNPIAYFCAEFALSDTLPIYSGGLGVLAGDMIKEAAELGIPFVGVGLLYKKGFYRQIITDQNTQSAEPQPINPRTAGLSLVLNSEGNVFTQSIPVKDRKVYFQVWQLKVGVVDMYFLDTDVDMNCVEDRQITATLYGGDSETRILQEIILGIGGEKALFAQGIYPTVYHMNEGHSAFAAFGIIHHHMKMTKSSFAEALESVRKKLIFTNHTLLAAGNDVFPKDMVVDHLKSYAMEVEIPLAQLIQNGLTNNGTMFSMTIFALNMAYKTNAVSILHAEKAKQLWPGFVMEPITNGVNLRTWIHPFMYRKLEDIILENSVPLEQALQYLSHAKLWEIHQDIKQEMLKNLLSLTGSIFDKNVCTITWARRIAEYKRPALIFSDIERLKRLLQNIQKPVQIIISGKPHPSDEPAKAILKQMLEAIKEINETNRIVYIPNYSTSLAQLLVAGSDIWLNNPIRGYEASGTSGMKAGANGVIQLTVKDGWTDEVDWYGAGWVLDSENTGDSLYRLIENDIVSTYYNRKDGLPEDWIQMMTNTMAIVITRYSSFRMLSDYMFKLYTPVLKGA